MKHSIPLAVVSGLLVGCGSPSDDCPGDKCDDVFPVTDAGPVECSPLHDELCLGDQKCAFVLREPATGEGYMRCVPNGDVEVGDSCSPPSIKGGADNCVRDSHCYGGTCSQICREDNCPAGDTCVWPSASFPHTLCRPRCDPLAQDCTPAESGESQGCYRGQWGTGCLITIGDGAPADEPCQYSEECERGTDCYGGVDRRCAAFCNPTECDPDAGVGAGCTCDADSTCLGSAEDAFGICDPS